jgi:hypothetical protein
MLIAGISITVFQRRWILFLNDLVNKKWNANLDSEQFNYLVGWLYLYNSGVFFIMFLFYLFSAFSERFIITIGDSIIVISDIAIIICILRKTRIDSSS